VCAGALSLLRRVESLRRGADIGVWRANLPLLETKLQVRGQRTSGSRMSNSGCLPMTWTN